MSMVSAPRILVAATASGVGKTTFACGLMLALARRGLRVQACKCGPDFIDPLFHERVVGAPSRNLDLFLGDERLAQSFVARGASSADFTVIEGAMGYYDGIAMGSRASAWDVARATQTPAVLLVDARGRARSLVAEVRGFAQLERDSHIAGVVLSRCSDTMAPRLARLVEDECGLPCLGHVPPLPDAVLPSRHLGLVTADEVPDLRARLGRVADALERTVDLDRLIALGNEAPDLPEADEGDGTDSSRGRYSVSSLCCHSEGEARRTSSTVDAGDSSLTLRMTGEDTGRVNRKPTIAVARDQAFCFMYADTLDLLERLGARIAFFSPLADEPVPPDAAALYVPGGYPELHAAALSRATQARESVRAAVQAGMPCIAECGGFLYLHEQLVDDQGECWPLAGVLPATARPAGRSVRFGYATLMAHADNLLCAAGETLPAHEFHYWESDDPGAAFHAQKPQSDRAWECVHATPSLYAGFPHLYLPGAPAAAARFVEAARAFDARRARSARDARDTRDGGSS